MTEYPEDIMRVARRCTTDNDIADAIFAERKRCASAVLSESLEGPIETSDDAAYNVAISHAHDAIWRVQ